jgi:hypothetical protein
MGDGTKRFQRLPDQDVPLSFTVYDRDVSLVIANMFTETYANNAVDALNIVTNLGLEDIQVNKRYRWDPGDPGNIQDLENAAEVVGFALMDQGRMVTIALNFWEGLYMAGLTTRSNDG